MPKEVYIVVPLLVVAGIMFLFLRSSQTKTAQGVIRSKTHKPAGQTYHYPGSTGGRGFNSAVAIPTAEAYVLEIEVPGWKDHARGLVVPHLAGSYAVGQQVRIEYVERNLAIWNRRYVTEVIATHPAGGPGPTRDQAPLPTPTPAAGPKQTDSYMNPD